LEYDDIAIRLFHVEVDGIVFGLVDETDEDGGYVEFKPGDLAFTEPWDGSYDT
jgi:uncharacterized cupin superfamily protein